MNGKQMLDHITLKAPKQKDIPIFHAVLTNIHPPASETRKPFRIAISGIHPQLWGNLHDLKNNLINRSAVRFKLDLLEALYLEMGK